MTTEELMKPRYKVIAGYPHMELDQIAVGDIISPYGMGFSFPKLVHEQYETFPHLFKKLEWYEERKPEEMPEYVRYSVYYLNHYHLAGYPEYENKIFKIERWENGNYGMKAIGERIIHPYEINYYPVNEEDYTAYINPKQPPNKS